MKGLGNKGEGREPLTTHGYNIQILIDINTPSSCKLETRIIL